MTLTFRTATSHLKNSIVNRKHSVIKRNAKHKILNCKRRLIVESLENRRLLASDAIQFVDVLSLERLQHTADDVQVLNHFAGIDYSGVTPLDVPWNSEQAELHLQAVKERVAGDESYQVDSEGNLIAIDVFHEGDSSRGDSNQISRSSDPEDAPPFPLEQTFLLNSRPGATKTVYLDFTGHTTTGTSWNSSTGVSPIITPAYTLDGNPDFSSAELEQIQRIWERVAEDFIPFEVNVTTQEPAINDLRNTGGSDTRWGIRVAIGANTGWYSNVGGVAYLNSFNWSSDTPTFVFNSSEKSVAEAVSHEVGHTLGLSHDGTSSLSYYRGHGSGPTGWAPIMGVGYDRELVQWSRGEYPDANQTQNDLQIITSNNGFSYRADDHANNLAGASQVIVSGTSVYGDGIIERTTDVDYFKFTTTGGNTLLDISPFYRSPNLDILATLYNSAGTTIATSNPVSSLTATFALSLTPGTYYLSIDGTGKAASGSDYGYSDYASLGYYSISGFVPNASAEVSQSFVYYKGSAFASGGVANALDSSKSLANEGPAPLTLDYSNVINSSRGINGLVFDIQGLGTTSLSLSDFEFQYSPTGAFIEADHPPADWANAPNPSSISVVSGSPSRVVLEWPDFAIANRWLRITINANSNTGLASPEVYYIGHLIGETTGATDGVYTVSFSDITPIRNAVGQSVGPDSIHDIDKDGTVAFLDISSMRDYVGLQLSNITIPMTDTGGSGGELDDSDIPQDGGIVNSAEGGSVVVGMSLADTIPYFSTGLGLSIATGANQSRLLSGVETGQQILTNSTSLSLHNVVIRTDNTAPPFSSSNRFYSGLPTGHGTAQESSLTQRIDSYFEQLGDELLVEI